MDHVHSVTVPGSVAGWFHVLNEFGANRRKGPVSWARTVLGPAIKLAEHGFPVSELSARFWAECEENLKGSNKGELLKDRKRPPRCGEVMKMPELAGVFRQIASKGPKGFYEGRVAEGIVNAVQENGGVMTLEDLRLFGEEGSQEVDPIGLEFDDVKVWECAPNGQGMVALMALGVIEYAPAFEDGLEQS